MGRPAASAVLGTDQAISRLRGKLFEIEVAGKKVPVIVTYHPSYLLRNLADKEKCWHDLLFVKRTLKEAEAGLTHIAEPIKKARFFNRALLLGSDPPLYFSFPFCRCGLSSPIMLERS